MGALTLDALSLPDYCRILKPDKVRNIEPGAVILLTSRRNQVEYWHGRYGAHPREEENKRDDGMPIQLRYNYYYSLHKIVNLKIFHSPFTQDPFYRGDSPVQPRFDLAESQVWNWHEVSQTYQSEPYNSKILMFLPKSKMINHEGQEIGDMVFFFQPKANKWLSTHPFIKSYELLEEGRSIEIPSSCVYIPPDTSSSQVLEDIIPKLLGQHMRISDEEDIAYLNARSRDSLKQLLPEIFPGVMHEKEKDSQKSNPWL